MVQMATGVIASGGHVLSWGWFSIELANLLIIIAMVVLFVVALLVPFGRSHAEADGVAVPGGDAQPGDPS